MAARSFRGVSRRRFIAGAGLALAGTVMACGQGQEAARLVSTSPPSSPASGAPPAQANTPAPTVPTAPSATSAPRPSPSPTVAVPASPTAGPASPTAGATAKAAASATPKPGVAAAPDMVLINGKVITVDRSDTIAQAVAIKDGRVQAAGSNEAIRGLVGAGTKVVDLKGKTVTPGLIDAHNHLQVIAQFGGYLLPFLPPEVKSLKEMQDRLAGLAAKTPQGEWIKGYYLAFSEGRPPRRQDLDKVTPEHPVWMMQQGGHVGAANSLAIKQAGLSASTASPQGGIIEKDASGELTGVFYNHRAMDLLRQAIPPFTTEMARDGILASQPLLAAVGVTSFQDNNVRSGDTIGAYLDIGRQGKMLLRGAVYLTLEWPQDVARALAAQRYEDPFMRFAGYKFLIDGQAPTAYCHQRHSGVEWNLPTWDPAMFKRVVAALHETGLQICVHCAGDAATDLVLDAYEAAMNAAPRPDPRHRIEHAVLTTPEATRRMRDLGVVVSTQPQFIRVGGNSWLATFGEERMNRVIVTREWLDAGVHVALGSDAPTTPWLSPAAALAGAVHRLNGSNKVVGPDQKLTIQEALRCHTIEAAYAAHEEQVKGSIEPGKLADLAVWGEDPYVLPAAQLMQAPIAMTIIGGKVVYEG
jgi:predicted amidohydrolase YtcJ